MFVWDYLIYSVFLIQLVITRTFCLDGVDTSNTWLIYSWYQIGREFTHPWRLL